MKLPIKKKYFELIKLGKKNIEFRDAHITFVCEETGEQLKKYVVHTEVIETDKSFEKYYEEGVLEDNKVILFHLN